PDINARGMVASDIDRAIRRNVERTPGGIGDKIVRQMILDIPRHIFRELDHRALREFRRQALHYHLDARRPEVVRTSAAGAPGRRPSLLETVRDRLRSRELPADIDREALVDLGVRYLREADTVESNAAVSTAESD